MVAPLIAKLAALGGAGTALVMDNKKERERIKKMVEEDKEKTKQEAEVNKKSQDGGRTKYIDRKMPEGKGKDILMGLSRMADKVGLKQDKTYEGKSDEELAKKKASGGTIKKFAVGGSSYRTGQPLRPGKVTGQPMKFKKGGSVSARADGCAQRGKTRGKMV
jgi:hypothetical protein